MTPELYVSIYYFILLIIVLCYSFFSRGNDINSQGILSFALLIFVFGIITFRDIDPIFGDTISYARHYVEYTIWGIKGIDPSKFKDVGFEWLTLFLSKFDNLTVYFGSIAIVYLLPVYLALKRGFNESIFVAFLLFVCSFSFFGYGVNGLRNGMATSLILAAMFSGRLWVQMLLILLATSFHGSTFLPGIMFIIAKYYHNPKAYLIIYVLFLFISLIVGEQLGNMIGDLEFISGADERLQGYLSNNMDSELDRNVASELFSRTGFRWDFLLYSLVPIILGYIYIYRLNYQDKLYTILFCTYVGCNACWLLTTYVPFNNRFAYLSWFFYSVVMSYPLLKEKDFVDYQQLKIKLMVLFNFAFTFIMYVI